jgi:hypothetical protein
MNTGSFARSLASSSSGLIRAIQLAKEELAANHLDPQVEPEGDGDDHEGPAAQAVGE